MFIVKKKQGAANIVWDASENVLLCRFVDGVFATGDKSVADKLKALGHEVSEECTAKSKK